MYANVVRITAGSYDLILDFGYRSPEQAQRTQADFDVVCRVAMSLAHAKSMLPLLAKAIADYEQRFGEIVVPNFDQLGKG